MQPIRFATASTATMRESDFDARVGFISCQCTCNKKWPLLLDASVDP